MKTVGKIFNIILDIIIITILFAFITSYLEIVIKNGMPNPTYSPTNIIVTFCNTNK